MNFKLTRTGSVWNRNQRIGINDNWDKLEDLILSNGEALFDSEAFSQWLEDNEFNFKKSVKTYFELPSNANKNDVIGVENDGILYIFDGEKWIKLIKVSFQELEEVKNRLQEAETNIETNHNNYLENKDKIVNLESDLTSLSQNVTSENQKLTKDIEDLDRVTNFKGVLLTLDRDISVNDKWVTVDWGKSEYNISGFWSESDSTKITIPKGVKKIRITASTIWTSDTNGTRLVRVQKNGGYFPGGIYTTYVAGGTTPHQITSGVINVKENDYLQMSVRQTAGVNLDLRDDPLTYISVECVEFEKKK